MGRSVAASYSANLGSSSTKRAHIRARSAGSATRARTARVPPAIRFGTSTWTYDGWHGDVYHRRYRGPQPAMLPILSGHAHRRVTGLAAAPGDLAGRLAGVSEFDRAALAEEAAARGLRLDEVGSYTTFATYGSALRFWPPRLGPEGWRTALRNRSPDALRTRIHLVRLARGTG